MKRRSGSVGEKRQCFLPARSFCCLPAAPFRWPLQEAIRYLAGFPYSLCLGRNHTESLLFYQLTTHSSLYLDGGPVKLKWESIVSMATSSNHGIRKINSFFLRAGAVFWKNVGSFPSGVVYCRPTVCPILCQSVRNTASQRCRVWGQIVDWDLR